jgi:hypothetical protein
MTRSAIPGFNVTAHTNTKAGQLSSLAGTLATIAVAGGGALGAAAAQVSAWVLMPAVPWSISVVVLLLRIIRPRLSPATFTDAENTPGETQSERCSRKIGELRPIVRARYVALLGGAVLAVMVLLGMVGGHG